MEHIEAIFTLAQGNQLLIFSIAILATFLESFIPALPLVGIVVMNAALLGFWGGIIASVIGSFTGTVILFLLARKFSSLKYFDRLRNEKTDKITNWLKNQNYVVIYIAYACVFVPDCLVSISSGFCGKTLKSFAPGMILGKITMFSVACYVGNDLFGLINHPEKIVIVLLMIGASFIIGKKMSNTMTGNNTVNA